MLKKSIPNKIQHFIQLIEQEIPIKVKFKDESAFMKLLSLVLKPLTKKFMTNFTTTIGYTVYFPNRDYLIKEENLALRILAHETVHLLDAKKWTNFIFQVSYLFPQILVLGVFSYPFLEYWAFLFLFFLAPIPSPTRFYWETRGYTMNIITHQSPSSIINSYLKYFTSQQYYFMYPCKKKVKRKIEYWMDRINKKEDKILTKIMNWYKQVIKDEI